MELLGAGERWVAAPVDRTAHRSIQIVVPDDLEAGFEFLDEQAQFLRERQFDHRAAASVGRSPVASAWVEG